MKVLYSSQSLYSRSGICEGRFLFLLWNLVILRRTSACFFFATSTSKVWFFSFFTLIGVKLLEITFLIINGDSCVIGVSVDSITMNLGKGSSMPSSELSVSINARLIFYLRKKP